MIPIPTEPKPYNIFDACVWKEGGMYYLLSAGTQPKGRLQVPRPAWFLFESQDLASVELRPSVCRGRLRVADL